LGDGGDVNDRLEEKEGRKIDDHASTCNICVAQAMMAFVWEEIGATEAEMQKAMKEIYGK
jgi:hypothetical protein